MTSDRLEALIAYRLEQARESLDEAEMMRVGGHLRATVNRAYYAMFYALQGLLINGGFSTSRHSGAISLFDREFVKTGRTGFSSPGKGPTDSWNVGTADYADGRRYNERDHPPSSATSASSAVRCPSSRRSESVGRNEPQRPQDMGSDLLCRMTPPSRSSCRT